VDVNRNTRNEKITILMKRAVDFFSVPYSQEKAEETKKTLHYDC